MYEKINYIANSTQKQRNNNKAKQTKADPGTINAKSFQQIRSISEESKLWV
jgi:hypothetical protein